MAEYYPLISRAVASLRGGAPQARQAIYGRARQALVAQLRGMTPPVPEEAINKEIAALDAAIARIETEIGPAVPVPPVQPPQPSDVAAGAPPASKPATPPTPSPTPEAAPRPAEPAVPPASPADLVGPPASTGAAARPLATRPPAPPVANTATVPARNERAVFERRSSLPPSRPLPPRSTRPPAPLRVPAADIVAPTDETLAPDEAVKTPDAATEPQRPTVSTVETREPAVESPAASTPPDIAPRVAPPLPLPVAATLGTDLARPADDPVGVAPMLRARSDDDDDGARALPAPDILAGEPRGRDQALRPAVPRQVERAPRDLRVWIVAIAAVAVLGAIALMAWKLRDNPEQLARIPPPAKTEPAAGKIAERADGPAEDADVDATTPATSPSPSPATTPSQAAQVGTSPETAPQSPPDQGIAVAYKAAILVSAPDTPAKVKTYVGTVVWRTESVAEGQGQPLGTAVKADIDVPDAKFQATMELRKNTEAQFPASHTIDLKFTVGPDSPIGNIKQIDVPRMRSEDAAAGDPLVGVPVTITTNYFLVGLTRGGAEQRNMDALRTNGWIDIPMVLENGSPAKITFEKGALGQQILGDALQAWNRS